MMLVLAVGALTVVMLATRRRIHESRALTGPSARERLAGNKMQRRSARDLEQVMLELDQLSRQIHGRIDTKLVKLETVLRDADERIDKLSRLVRASGGSTTRAATLKPTTDTPESKASRAEPSGAGDRRDAMVKLAERGTSMVEIAREMGSTPGEVELVVALHKAKSRGNRAGSQVPGSGPAMGAGVDRSA